MKKEGRQEFKANANDPELDAKVHEVLKSGKVGTDDLPVGIVNRYELAMEKLEQGFGTENTQEQIKDIESQAELVLPVYKEDFSIKSKKLINFYNKLVRLEEEANSFIEDAINDRETFLVNFETKLLIYRKKIEQIDKIENESKELRKELKSLRELILYLSSIVLGQKNVHRKSDFSSN